MPKTQVLSTKSPVLIRPTVINTKMDRAVKAGVVKAHLKKHPLTTVILFQEVSNPAQLQKALPAGWHLAPHRQLTGENHKLGTQYVAYKTTVWKLLQGVNDDIAGANGRHGRRMLAVKLVHKRSKKVVWFLDCHPDPLGEGVVKASPAGRRIQRGQLLTFSKFIRKTYKEALISGEEIYFVLGGDLNQSFAVPLPKQYEKFGVKHIFGEVGLDSAAAQVKNAGQKRLLEFFVSENVKVRRRIGYTPDGFGADVLDHEIVFAELELR